MGWRCLLHQPDQVLTSAETITGENGCERFFTPTGTLRRLDSSRVGNRRRLVETKDQAYELRLLHVPALYTMAR